MRSLIAFLLMLAVAAGLVVVVWPNAWFTLQLALEPAPTALPVPVQGVSAAQLRDSWGNARAGGRRHEGIDIFAARGTPVRSTTRGIIWRVGEDRLGGHVVL
ncbi:MAG TPA: M23 family metallopeptidase, partial [Casimicrobiaceae bacterium]|nr:M23 family metallopeptidase [Casimicrobiaceae bacterium]